MITISDASLGTNESLLHRADMFPNPSMDYVARLNAVQSDGSAVNYLTDSLALSTILEATISTVNISNLTSGIYFINVVTNSAFHTLSPPKE